MLGVNHQKNLLYPNLQHIYVLFFKNFIRAFFRSGVIVSGNNCVHIIRYKVIKRLAMRPALAQVVLENPIFFSILLSIIGWTIVPIDALDVTNVMTKLQHH